jgi:hypothetical protein
MKKVITLVLAIALVLTSVVAIAETVEAPAAPKGTPNVASFATMKTKYNESNHIITITLSKPVDRLLIVWAEKGAEPEELAVGEDLTATALTWGHKYMPGTTQYYATWETSVSNVLSEEYVGIDVDTSERIYNVTGSELTGGTYGPVWNVTDLGPARDLEYGKAEAQIAEYKADYAYADYIIVEPFAYIDADGNEVVENGYIQGVSDPYKVINSNFQTVIATPAQTAYMTVQGEWAVYYNRAGKIVGIEYFDGQF